MTRLFNSAIRVSIGLLASLVLTSLPLRAQLDPRLQASKTDFLDLFQQSTNAKPKPEVVTVFDFSGSMAAIMFHPQYVNLDRTDSGSRANMTFVLSGTSPNRIVTATVKGTAVGTLTSTKLIRPNGTQVTEATWVAVSPTGVLFGDTFGAGDVRNWIRGASHVRFAYTDSGVLRTVDIPIPWKITNSGSTGNPLSGTKVLDSVVKNNPDGTTTTYGSGLQIEMDMNWSITSGSAIMSLSSGSTTVGGAAVQTSTILGYSGGVGMYPYDYVDWLFKGKYTDGPYAGKYIVFDSGGTVPAAMAGGQSLVGWGQGYGNMTPADRVKVPLYNLDRTIYLGNSWTGAAPNPNPNGLTQDPLAADLRVPGYTRQQAVKRGAIQTWIENQGDVLWAFRFLDPSSEGSPNGNTLHNNSATFQNVAVGVPTTVQTGRDSTWTLLNNTAVQGINSTTGNSVTGMRRIATLFVGNSTPLTYATANALAQFNDPNNVFSAVETGTDTPTTCMNHFLIVFTDGIDNNNSGTNNPNGTTPYIVNAGTPTVQVNALAGNRALITTPTLLDRLGVNWNMFSFTGAAAHLADSGINGTTGVVGTDYLAATVKPANSTLAPSAFLPFAIKQRGVLSFGTYGHRITTMTLGVSLGGFYNDTAAAYPLSPKRTLFFGASVGDPTITSGLLSTFHSFDPDVDWIPDPNDPGGFPVVGKRAPGAIYFFDATNPELLAKDLQYALRAAKGAANVNATSSPNIPFIGASFGREVYLGKFIPPSTGGVLWNGDLLMFATKEVANQIILLDKSGNPASIFDSTTAQWSTQAVLANTASYPWAGRKLYTRIPGTAALPENGLSAFTYTGTAYTDATKGLKNFVGTDPNTHTVALTDAAKQTVIQLVSGANINGPVNGSGIPTQNRANIMGDIVNSSPTAIEYNFSDVKTSLSSTLTSAGTRFRLVFTGTNQGWLHAFGEVSMIKGDTDPVTNTTYTGPTTGKVEELWAFIPTDFLANLDYLKVTNNIHRFMVDGNPTIYHLDLPPAAGGSGNGVVDSTERAIVIIGLGKGGRSYYALDIHNPITPNLMWSLVPDEAAFFPAARIAPGGPALATVQSVLSKMGFSTNIPALGRVFFNGKLRDVVFFGGGYSTTDVEHNFPIYPSPPAAQQTPLGRSVLAVDVYSGEILSAIDLSATVSGPIAAGLVPFEFFLNSGMAQRAYFLDFKGGLWCWGSKGVSNTGPTDPLLNYRQDTSDLAKWTTDGTASSLPAKAGIRKVAQDGTGTSAIYSTLPAPFRVGYFPGAGKVAGSPPPAAVGITMISGDRNNPLDYSYTALTTPTDHRLTVVFDRQDSRAWNLDTSAGPDTGILDANLIDFTLQNSPTASTITPSNVNYYLAPTPAANTKFGYTIYLPPKLTSGFIPKGVNTPSTVAGSLFYSYFTPTSADPCTGGDGTTTTSLICDVINPIVNDSRTDVTCKSGFYTTWSGIASNFSAYGTRGVVQGGAIPIVNPLPDESKTTLSLKTLLGKQSERFPKVRVWRTVR